MTAPASPAEPSGSAAGGGGPGRPRSGVPVGRWFGVPVVLDITWLLLAAYVTIFFADLPAVAEHGATARYVAGFGTAVLLAVSVLLHELGHSVVAQRLGLRVRRITLFLLGGVSEIEDEPQTPARETLIAVAGPLVSVALAGIGVAVLATDVLDDGLLRVVVVWVTLLNTVLAVFNLLPGLPLDGGRITRAAVWRLRASAHQGTVAAAWTGRVIGALVMGYPLVLIAFGEPFQAGILITVLVGLYIYVSAGQALVQTRLRGRLPAFTAGAFARPTAFVDVNAPVSELVRRAVAEHAAAVALVDSAGRVVALVDDDKVAATEERRRPWVSADEVSRRLEPQHLLPAGLSGDALLHRLGAVRASHYLVLAGERPVGVLAAHDVAEAVRRTATG